MCACVCACVCVHVCMHVRVCVCVSASLHDSVDTYSSVETPIAMLLTVCDSLMALCIMAGCLDHDFYCWFQECLKMLLQPSVTRNHITAIQK